MIGVGQRIRRWLGRRKTLPARPRSSDVYLVSFPKSGNTWLRFLVANLVREYFDVPCEVNWFTIQGIIPDIHRSRDLDEAGPFGLAGMPRLIKSHARYHPGYHRALILTRDPRSVMVSWHEYLKEYGRVSDGTTLHALVADPARGIRSWAEHTRSWLGRPAQGQSVKFFRYEDLIADPAAQLERIARVLGLRPTAAQLASAVERSSRDAMREDEDRYRSDFYLNRPATRFVGSGPRRDAELDEKDLDLIRREAGDVMRELGYE